ncbi:MAG: nicotinamide-nucleotide amidase [Pseudonocardiales bacterium]|nr:nicotinamide-nucleotide amidase [Pseudonocardiales bacterium]
MSSRAGIVVTGTEVLTGRVRDRNGPWLAEQLRRHGVDIAQIVVVGDRPDDVAAALGFLAHARVDLIITSGGLGPTADDLTAEVVASFQGRPRRLDEQLELHISAIVERFAAGRGWRLDPDATAAATRKQAMVPVGASVLTPVGTAAGLVVPPGEGRAGPPVVVLPGPPRELQGMWPGVLADRFVQVALAARTELLQSTIRLWGTPESELAATLRTHDDALAGLEITTCLRDGELEIVTRYGPDAQPAYGRFAEVIADAYGETLFSTDGRTIDDLVAEALLERKLTIATAESCTAGLLVARLTERPGSSTYVLGGVATYSNESKHAFLGVPTELIESVGAVSAEVAAAMARGARARFGADIAVGITGIAGPDGGTSEKPVGLVHLCVTDGGQVLGRALNIPGGRTDVRARAVTIAMHLIRRILDSAVES